MASRDEFGHVELHVDRPHSARIYDFMLGGKNNFAADREAAVAILESAPNLPVSMRANRRFMVRMARHVAADLKIRQFLDVGTGLPTSPNLHEVVQGVAPESRILYVDNDPIVLVHARALLTSSPEGRTGYLEADMHDPESIVSSSELRDLIDLGQPVAVSLLAILHFVEDDSEARRIVEALMRPMSAGSVLALSAVSSDSAPQETGPGGDAYRQNTGLPARARTKTEFEALFGDLELLDPGVKLAHRWCPEPEDLAVPEHHAFIYAGLAIKR